MPQALDGHARDHRGEARELHSAKAQHAGGPRMACDALVVADRDLDERDQQLPPLVALDLVEQVLEGLVGLEELSGVEAPHAVRKARGKSHALHLGRL